MSYCPNCHAEYEDWATVCADCAEPLLPGAAPEPDPPPLPVAVGEWAYVTNVPNAIIGNLLVSQLKDAGIPALLRRSTSADVGELSHDDFVTHDILAPAPLTAQARRYLDSPPASPYRGLA